MTMQLSELLAGFSAGFPDGCLVHGPLDKPIDHVVEDSRQVVPGCLFVARPGTHADGSTFLRQALQQGAGAVVCDLSTAASDIPTLVAQFGATLIDTRHPAAMLGYLAHRIAGDPARQMQLLAVTGTNGKTTITFLLRSIFRAARRQCGLIGTVQTDDGRSIMESSMTTPAPLELANLLARMIKNGATAVVMEASSHALAQDRLAGLNYQVAMFSNLTGDHLDYHGTMENYAAAKARLFSALSSDAFAVINTDDPWSSRMVRDCRASVVSYALDAPAQFTGRINRIDAAGMELQINGPDGLRDVICSPMVGRYNAQNLLCAIAGAWCAGLGWNEILSGLRAMDRVPGRLETVQIPGISPRDMPFHVLVDYAHTHDALQNVLHAIRPWTRGKIILVFGCGGDRDVTKRPKMAAVAEQLADDIFLTQDNPRTENPQAILAMIMAGFSAAGTQRVQVCPDRAQAINAAIISAQSGDVVLIAGKGHENYQILGTVKHHFDDVEQAAAVLRKCLAKSVSGVNAEERAKVSEI